MNRSLNFLLSGLLSLTLASVATAQTQVASTGKPDANDIRTAIGAKENAKSNEKKDVKKTAQTTNASCESCRWFEPTIATFSMRYRTTTDVTDTRTLDQGQQRIVLAGKFKFDKDGRYTVNVHASSGYYFNWAYADTGLGNTVNEAIRIGSPGIARYVTPEVAPAQITLAVQQYIAAYYPGATPEQIAYLTPLVTAQLTPIVTEQVRAGLQQSIANTETRTKGWNLYVRQLYFKAIPIRGLEFSYGSMGINKGVNTEATSYDDDGYVSGLRVSVKRPKQFWFDEFSVTYGYLGDIFKPNFFRRTSRFKQSNYHQFLLRKKFGNGKIDVSGDYTFQDGSDTMREAVRFDTKKSGFLDSVRVEAYQRVGDVILRGKLFKAGNGFSVQAEKTLWDRLNLNGSYADIDRAYTLLGEYDTSSVDWFGFAINGDQTGLGKRFIGKANYKLTKDIGLSMLYSQTVSNKNDEMKYYWNKTHFNMAITYDILEGVRRLGWFR